MSGGGEVSVIWGEKREILEEGLVIDVVVICVLSCIMSVDMIGV